MIELDISGGPVLEPEIRPGAVFALECLGADATFSLIPRQWALHAGVAVLAAHGVQLAARRPASATLAGVGEVVAAVRVGQFYRQAATEEVGERAPYGTKTVAVFVTDVAIAAGLWLAGGRLGGAVGLGYRLAALSGLTEGVGAFVRQRRAEAMEKER